MKFLVPVVALMALSLSTSGCSVNPATGKSSFTGLMSEQEELQVGRQEHPKILKQFGGAYDHQAMQAYVDRLGQKLAKVSEMPNLKWTFTVLDDPVINAFALPGGYIYISRGLIGLAENEAELVAVLGHEIGHVTGRHTAQRYSQSVVTGLGAAVLGAVIGGPAGRIANYAGQAYLAGYGRDHEMEADMLGIRYMTKLGYDPKASASFFKKLAEHTELEAKMKGKGGKPSHYGIFATHPDTKSRIAASTKIAQRYPADLDILNRDYYLRQIHGISYGESISQGITDGRRFIHPGLRFKFEAPRGFKIDNQPTLVAATHSNGSAMIFSMGNTRHGKLPMTRYLQEIWANKYNLRNVEAITVNGLPAATGEIRIQTKRGLRDLRYVAIEDNGEIFRFQFLTPTNLTSQMALDFRKSTYSFNRISRNAAKKIKGRHIHVHKVQAGDTIGKLAKRMKVSKFQEDWLKTLNKEQLADGLQRGEKLKLVLD